MPQFRYDKRKNKEQGIRKFEFNDANDLERLRLLPKLIHFKKNRQEKS